MDPRLAVRRQSHNTYVLKYKIKNFYNKLWCFSSCKKEEDKIDMNVYLKPAGKCCYFHSHIYLCITSKVRENRGFTLRFRLK